jgi:anti-anti-sigma factor
MISSANIKIEQINDIAIITPHGDLERYLESLLTRVLGSLLDADTRKVILNLSEVEYVHYELLQNLTQVITLFRSIDGDLRFAEANSYVKKIFQAATFDTCGGIFDSLGDALLSFEEQTLSREALH